MSAPSSSSTPPIPAVPRRRGWSRSFYWGLALAVVIGAATVTVLDPLPYYETLLDHWFDPARWEPEVFTAMLHYILWLLVWLGVVAVAALLWSWLLRRQVTQRTRQLLRELHERQQVEVALRESEARFRDVTEAASDWIWEMNERLRFTHLSERFYALTGIAPHHVLGRARWEIGAADSAADLERWRQHRELLEQHLPFRDFVYQTRLSGNHNAGRYLKVSGKPIYDVQGRFLGYRGTGTDITEQIRAETALRESELRLRRIIDLVPHMIFAKDRNGRFLLANSATAKAIGVTVDDLVQHPHPIVHSVAEETERMLADDREVIDSGIPKLIAEETFTDHAGQTRTLQTIKIPFIEPGLNETAVWAWPSTSPNRGAPRKRWRECGFTSRTSSIRCLRY